MTIAYITSFVDDELITIVYTPHEDDQDAMNDVLNMQSLTLVEEDWDNGKFIAKNADEEQFTIQLTYVDKYTTIYQKE